MLLINCKMKIPKKLVWLFRKFIFEVIVLFGGRGSAKTETVGRKLIEIAMKETTRILCTREIQNSIDDSVKKTLEDIIEECDLSEYFYITKNSIRCLVTGTDFIFKGLKAGTDPKSQSIKSMKGIKYVWIEEAQTISVKSLDILTPTIREAGRIFFFTMNRQTSTDAVFERYKDDPKAKFFQINYMDNEFCPETLIEEAEKCKLIDIDSYNHIWLGEPASDTPNGVIKRLWVNAAIEMYGKARNDEGKWFGGLDPADGGKDHAGFSLRKGLCLEHVWEWPGLEADDAAQMAINRCTEHITPITSLCAINYEITGIGAGARAKFKQHPNMKPKPFNPAGGVQDPNNQIVPGHKNKDHFSNLKAQQWWKLRILIRNAYSKLHQKPYTGNYLTINPKIPILQKLIDELCQIEYTINEAGKIKINKKPKDTKSPNLADSLMISTYIPKEICMTAVTV